MRTAALIPLALITGVITGCGGAGTDLGAAGDCLSHGGSTRSGI